MLHNVEHLKDSKTRKKMKKEKEYIKKTKTKIYLKVIFFFFCSQQGIKKMCVQ